MNTSILFLISGAFSAGFAVIAEVLLLPGKGALTVPADGSPFPFVLLFNLLMVAVIEESVKLLVLERQSRNLSPRPVGMTALPFGLGFAIAESALAFFSAGSPIPAWAIAGLFLLHVGTTLLYGITAHRGRAVMGAALFFGITLHFVYDILLALA